MISSQSSLIRVLCLVLLAMPLAGCDVNLAGVFSGPSSQSSVPELPRHWLVFAHHSDAARKDYDIFRIAADGSQMASVVTLPAHQSQLAISPNGEELVFTSLVDGKYDIWRRRFGGGQAENITKNPASDSSPCSCRGSTSWPR